MISVNKWSLTRSFLFPSPIVLMAGAAVNAMQLQKNTANTDWGSTSLSVLLLWFGCWVLPLSFTPPPLPPPRIIIITLQTLHYAVASLEPWFWTLPAPFLDCGPGASGYWPARDSKASGASHWEQMWVTAALRNWGKGREVTNHLEANDPPAGPSHQWYLTMRKPFQAPMVRVKPQLKSVHNMCKMMKQPHLANKEEGPQL